MDIQSIQTPQQLLQERVGLPAYELGNFIKVDRMGQRRLAKRKLKLLKLIDPELQNILEPDETVFFVSNGTLVNTAEQLFIGWAAYYYNATAFVFTTKRVLLIHIKDLKTRGVFLRSIDYADIRRVKGSLFSGFKIQLRNGSTLTFSRVPGADRKELVEFLNQVLDTTAPKDPQAIGMRNLCPNCLTDYGEALVPGCHCCGQEFKTGRKAAIRSLILPGLGDIYLGSKVLGTLELVFMGFLWLMLLVAFIATLSDGGSLLVALLPMIVLWAFVHPADAIKAYYMGSKGLFPVPVPSTYGSVSPDEGLPVEPKRVKGSRAKVLLWIPGTVIFVFLLMGIVITLLEEAGIVPGSDVIPGSDLPDTYQSTMIENGLLDAESTVLFYYGGGAFSFTDSGTVLTDDRLMIYYHDESQQLLAYELFFDQISHVEQLPNEFALGDNWYKATGADPGAYIIFPLPAEGAGLFLKELDNRIALP